MPAVGIQWSMGQCSWERGGYDNGYEKDVSEGSDLGWWVREGLAKEVLFNLNWEG